MATVYLAKDLKHERTVAIKVLRPGALRLARRRPLPPRDPGRRQPPAPQHPRPLRLGRGRRAAVLRHAVHRGRVAPGPARTRSSSSRSHDALQIIREAAEALQYAHERGIVHRDIKPENILLLGGHALVADFGIARAVSQAGGEKLTQTGMAIGTPHYMSPEQSLGSEHVDARSDVYSLGCVLYELLIGQPPFTGPNAMAIMARHSMEVVPSLQVVRAVGAGRGRGRGHAGAGEDAGRPVPDDEGVRRAARGGGGRGGDGADRAAAGIDGGAAGGRAGRSRRGDRGGSAAENGGGGGGATRAEQGQALVHDRGRARARWRRRASAFGNSPSAAARRRRWAGSGTRRSIPPTSRCCISSSGAVRIRWATWRTVSRKR